MGGAVGLDIALVFINAYLYIVYKVSHFVVRCVIDCVSLYGALRCGICGDFHNIASDVCFCIFECAGIILRLVEAVVVCDD